MPLTAKPRAGLGRLAHVFANTPLEWKAPGSTTPGPVTRACVLPHGLSGHVFGSDACLASATLGYRSSFPSTRSRTQSTGSLVVTAAAAGSSPQLKSRCRCRRRRSRGNKATPPPTPFCWAEAQAGELARPPSSAFRHLLATSARAQCLIGYGNSPSLGACC